MTLHCVVKPSMWLGLKQILLYIALLLCVVLQVTRSKTQLFCPSLCTCDLYEQRNRATCSAKRLISANLEMPKSVQILNLSYNDITSIDAGSFESTVHLTNLSLAHNAIQSMHVDAFAKLKRLQSLDLAYNRLEQVDDHLLEGNLQLIYLNLEGNKLATLGEQPLLRSMSLRVLSLRNSQINQMSIALLSALPQLRELDVAQNLLLTLSSGVFHAPRLLNILNVDENPLNCDAVLIKVFKGLMLRGVDVQSSDCSWAEKEPEDQDVEQTEELNTSHQLDRIEHIGTNTQAPQSVLSIWRDISDDSSEEEVDQTKEEVCEGSREQLCRRYHNCLERMSNALLTPDQTDSMHRTHTFDEDDVKLAFAVGIATGMCTVIFIITFVLCIKNCCEVQRKNRNSSSTDSSTHQLQGLTTTNAVPVPQRSRLPRRSNPRRPPSTRAVVRQPYGPQDNFVSRLFGRPARQQYYRTLNQNTATLIRRLSRSNLFVNRTSEPSSPVTPPAATAQFYTRPETPPASTMQFPTRPETPPPNYGDVVLHCDNK